LTLIAITISAISGFTAIMTSGSDAQARTAEHIEGLIDVKYNQIMLRLSQLGKSYPIYCETHELMADLEKLSTGDLLVGTGELHADKQVVVLQSIDMVGLRRLLGTWRTVHSEVFEFKDFNRLHVYPSDFRKTMTLKSLSKDFLERPAIPDSFFTHLQKLNYTLAPDSNSQSRWSIFMADHQSVRIGSLMIHPTMVKLTVYDPDTGRIASEFDLARVTSQSKQPKVQTTPLSEYLLPNK
jgi:hypothetical protein